MDTEENRRAFEILTSFDWFLRAVRFDIEKITE